MPWNAAVFKTRTLTAIVFAAVMLAGIFINGWLYSLLILVIMVGAFYEFHRLMKITHGEKYMRYFPLAILYVLLPLMMLLQLGFTHTSRTENGVNFIVPSVVYNPLMPAMIIFSIWINDTMAYIVGSLIGKTPFSKISPKKTWEGTIGGAILCMAVITLAGAFIPALQVLHWKHWMVIATLCAVFGTLGDLFESRLKRRAGVKDSGSFMPGHGGFLDRFDSLLFASPAVWLYLQLFLRWQQ